MKNILTILLLFAAVYLPAQSNGYRYPMVFKTAGDSIISRDTSLSGIQLSHWAKADNFPSSLKWKNAPFLLRPDAADVLMLCSDSATTFHNNDVIGYMLFKCNATGTFRSDYKLSSIAKYIGNSSSANVDIEMTTEGILMKSHGTISPGEPLLIDYEDLYDMFPGDPTVAFVNY